MNRTSVSLLASAATLVLGFVAGRLSAPDDPGARAVRQSQTALRGGMDSSAFRYINPLLDCESFSPSDVTAMVALEDSLNSYVRAGMESGRFVDASVYFRALNTGPWIGINEDESYSPASLLKVPLLLAVLRLAESDKDLLSREIQYTHRMDTVFVANIRGEEIDIGQKYTMRELLRRMIQESDNEAKELVVETVGMEAVERVMTDLGLTRRGESWLGDFLSVREYASIFRVLFNATYLDRDMSEFALDLMSHSRFTNGIPGGLPRDIVVAHKFGERGTPGSRLVQMHDCGTVYASDSPYLLCVMTRGYAFYDLVTGIEDISRIVYSAVSR